MNEHFKALLTEFLVVRDLTIVRLSDVPRDVPERKNQLVKELASFMSDIAAIEWNAKPTRRMEAEALAKQLEDVVCR